MTKVYRVWVDNSGTLRSHGFVARLCRTRKGAEKYIEELKNTTYKNYYAEFWIDTEPLYD